MKPLIFPDINIFKYYLSQPKLGRIITETKNAIAGHERDYTSGSISKAVFLLSVPMVLEMLMESIFAIVDIFFVSRLGSDAVSTVGITESLITIIYALAIGLSTATSAIISRRIGEKNKEEAAITAYQAIITGVIVSFIIAIPGFLFSNHLLRLMGMDMHTAAQYGGYTAIMLGGNAAIMLLFIINAVFRSAGNASISMKVLILANLINLILDPLLIFGLGPFPELGIKGAAIATTTGRGIAVIFQLYILIMGKGKIKIKRRHLKINFRIIGNLISLSLGGTAQSLIATSSWIGLVRIISVFGSQVVAGYTIAIRIVIFALLPSVGISNASATLVGQNLGAEKPERAEQSVWITSKINLLLLGIIGLILVISPTYFVGLFIDVPGVIKSGAECLRIISFGFMSYGFGMVLINSFNGAGDTLTPTRINLFCFWLFEIPLAYILAIKTEMREHGVFYAILIAETAMTLTAFLIFRKGKWKLKQV